MKNIRFVAVLSLCCLATCVYANPLGGVVASGTATITPSGNLLTIGQSSGTAIINWNTFNIAIPESTVFEFNGAAGANSAVLNLVNAANGSSTIAGTLGSTVGHLGSVGGTVLLLNPAGILFTPTAQVNVGSLVASTLELRDQNDFLNNRTLRFSGASTAGIQNQGNLNALGDIFLIANTVQNSGAISAGNEAGLAAGTTVTLAQSGAERLTVVAGTGTGTPIGVDNTVAGQINAVTAELKAAGGNVYALAINNGGAVHANTFANEGGHIYLRASGGNIQNSGSLSANNAGGSGGSVVVDGGHNATAPSTVINSGSITAQGSALGGQVKLLGDQVAVGDGAVVDVSGGTGGGTALIGGDLHGANPAVQNAQATFISPSAQIKADALTLGNGGKVVVWSDDATRFYGNISTRGGAQGGNGGFVEVSGNQSLVFEGNVDAAAPNGTAGQLLLDPNTLYIINGAKGTGDQDANIPIIFATANTALNTLSVGELQFLGNVDITLQAKSTITIGDSIGDPADVNLAGTLTTHTLTLSAGNGTGGAGNVVFNPTSSIETGGGNVIINAGQAGDLYGSVTLGAVTTGGGALTINAPLSGALSGVLFNGAINTGAGSVTLNISGATTIDATVNAASLTTDAAGTTAINADITTTGGQTYNDAVTLGGAGVLRTLTGVNVDFVNTLAGGTKSLTVDDSGTTTFGGAVSGVNALITDAAGNTAINADITTTGGQTYNDAVTLGGAGVLRTLTGVNVDFVNTLAGGTKSLTVDDSGTTTFGGAVSGVNALITDAAGNTAINADITTTGGQTYNDAVTLGGVGVLRTLTGVNVDFVNTLAGGTKSLTVDDSGTTTFGGAVSGVNALITDAAGNTAINADITTTGGQTYNDAVTLGGVGVLRTLTGVNVDFVNTLAGGTKSLTVDDSGTTTFGGAVSGVNALITDAAGNTAINADITTTGGQTYNDAVTLGGAGVLRTLTGVNVDFVNTLAGGTKSLTVDDSGTTTFGGAVSGVNALITDAAGNTAINADITTTGGQTYNDAVTLGGAGVLRTLTGVNVDFVNTLAGGTKSLTVDDSGTTTFGGAVSGVNALITDAAGNTAINADITTTGGQTYNDAVTLGGAGVLRTLTGVNVDFVNTLAGGTKSLTVDDSGTTTFGGAVSGVNALITDAAGNTAINADITTTGGQTYNDAVTLGGAGVLRTLTGVNVDFVNTLAGGTKSLTVDDSGTTTFGGAVSGVNALITDAAGNTAINADITTTGGQTYNDAVTLGGAGVLRTLTGVNVDFVNTLAGGTKSLTVDDSGTTTFGGAVSGVNALITDAAGNTAINADITTTGGQTYNDAVTLGGAGVLRTLTGVNVDFVNTLAGGTKSLTVDDSGTTTFGGAVSGVNALTTDAAGSTVLGRVAGAPITIDATATDFKDDVALDNNVTVNGTTATFEKTVNADLAANNRTLAVNAGGVTTFDGSVGNNQSLASLTTDAAGSTVLGSAAGAAIVVDATTVDFADDVVLDNNVTVNGTTATFEKTVNADLAANNRTLTVNASGVTTFDGSVGNNQSLASLTTDAAGSTVLGRAAGAPIVVDATTTDFKDDVVLDNNVTVNGTTATFEKTVNADLAGNNRTLTVNASGVTTFDGSVGNNQSLASLTTDAAGSTVLGSAAGAPIVVDATATDFKDDVALDNNVTVNGTTATFEKTVNADLAANNRTLAVNAGGVTTFDGSVGNNQSLASLTTDAAGSTVLGSAAGAPIVVDATTVDFADDVVLDNNVTVNGTTATFEKTVNADLAGNNRTLAVNAGGVTTFDGSVGNNQSLASLTTDAAGSTVLGRAAGAPIVVDATTTDFKDDVVLDNNVTVNGTTATFEKTVNADLAANNRTLTVNASGVTTFDGSVGNNQSLASLTTDAAGSTVLGNAAGAPIVVDATTTDFKDDVVLDNNVTVNGTTATFEKTVNADLAGNNRTLTVNASGVTTFDGSVGNNQSLASLTTDAAGSTVLGSAAGAPITIDATATDFKDDVALDNNVTVNGTTATFEKTVNADLAANNRTLAVNAGGVTTFDGSVGNNQSLASLTTDAAGSTVLGSAAGAAIVVDATTTDFKDDVVLDNNVTVNGTTATFEKTVNADLAANNRTLTVNASGVTTFDGSVGNNQSLASLTTDAAGSTVLGNAAGAPIVVDATTTDFKDDVVLDNNVTVNGTTATFEKTVNADLAGNNRTLTVNASGVTTFDGSVGNTAALLSLTTDAAGSTVLGRAAGAPIVVDATTVDFADDVVLDNNVTVNGTTVTFEKTVNADLAGNNRTLTVNASGVTTFDGAVGFSQSLLSLTTDAQGGLPGEYTALNGPVVNATTVDFADDVVLGNNVTVNGTTATFEKTVNADLAGNNRTLTVNASGVTTFDGSVGNTAPLLSLTTDAAGSTTLANGGSAITINAGTVDFADAVTLADDVTIEGDTTLNPATQVTFENTVDGAQTLTINSAATELDGDVGDTTPLVELHTIDALGTTTLANGGSAITINAGTVDFADAVTLADDVTIEGDTTPNPATQVTFENTVDGAQTLTINSAATELDGDVGDTTPLVELQTIDALGTTTLANGGSAITINAGTVDFADAVTLADDVTIEGDTTPNPATQVTFENTVDGAQTLTINSAATELDGDVGDTTPLVELQTIDALGTTTLANGGSAITINAGTVDFADAVTLADDVTIEGDTTPNPATQVTFENTVDGAQTLTINSAATELDGDVGDTTPLVELQTIDALGTTTLANGGSAITINAGTVDFADAVTLADDVTIEGDTTPNPATQVTFENTVDGAQTLTINSAATELDGDVGDTTPLVELQTIDALGTTTLANGGSAITINAGTVDFKDAVTLADDVTIEGDTTPTPATSVLFENTVDGAQTLVINSVATEFDNDVGATTPLVELQTIDPIGATQLGQIGGSAITVNAGIVDFADAVTLADDVTVNGTTATFENTVNADLAANNRTLAVNAGGVTTFGGSVGNNQSLASLTTDAAGSTVLGSAAGAPITVDAATVDFADDVVLDNNVTVNGTTVTFEKKVNGDATANHRTLAVNAGGVTTFDGLVGNSGVLASLTTDAQGGLPGEYTALNGAVVNATTVDFADDVVLGNNVTVNGTTVTFENTVNADLAANNRTLTVNAGGVTTFDGAVGNNQSLASLTTDAAGSTAINADITTTAGQTYNDTVTLGGAGALRTLTSTTIRLLNGVTFNGYDLTLNNGGQATFGGTFTQFNLLAFNGSMALGADTTLEGTAVPAFNLPAVTGNNHSLTLGNSGLATLNGAVSGVKVLTANAGTGTLQVNSTIAANKVVDNQATTLSGGTVTTTAGNGQDGSQTYSGAVTLGVNTTLTGVAETLAGVTGGGKNLTLNNSGVATLNGAVALGAGTLTANGVGGTLTVKNTIAAWSVVDTEATTFNVNNSTPANPTVSTTAGQTYGTVTLEQNTVLKDTSGSINASSVTANGNLLYYYLLNYIPPKLILVTGLFQDDILTRMLGAILPTYQPIEVRRQKPVGPGHRTKLPPWMITLPKNSLEVPFDQD